MPRIVSFLPAGSEIAHAIGAGADLVARSHECDYPPVVQQLPVVSRPALQLEGLSLGEIDRAVAGQLGSGASLYHVDEVLLRELAPDVVLTQDLCQVCAPSGTELTRALAELPSRPEVLWLTPQDLAGIEDNIRDVGRVTGRDAEAAALVQVVRDRIAAVHDAVRGATPQRMVFLEWTDPLFCAGHWVPEMVALAGGDDPLGKTGGDSVRMEWNDLLAAEPQLVVVAPCGYGLEQSAELARALPRITGARVVAVDANAYFARPGPRVAEGVELLGHLLHPDRVPWPHAWTPWEEIQAAD
jgi:iron complex transport system substrate-binding protein